MNIPIYRAKKIDSDEYVEGYYSPDKNYQEHIHTIFYFDIGDFNVDRKTTTQIDPTTLAIHFPDMLDSQGNKIFASLSASGKGGDIMKDDEYYGIAKYVDCKFVVEYENCFDVIDEGNFEAIGIEL